MTFINTRYKDWSLRADKTFNLDTYTKIEKSSSEVCNCKECRNFFVQKKSIYPTEIKELFIILGIDIFKEPEISHFADLENGLHFYSGWFHFKGSFTGFDCTKTIENGGYTTELIQVNKNFSIGFRNANSLSFFKESKGVVQVEFSCTIPWLIDKIQTND